VYCCQWKTLVVHVVNLVIQKSTKLHFHYYKLGLSHMYWTYNSVNVGTCLLVNLRDYVSKVCPSLTSIYISSEINTFSQHASNYLMSVLIMFFESFEYNSMCAIVVEHVRIMCESELLVMLIVRFGLW